MSAKQVSSAGQWKGSWIDVLHQFAICSNWAGVTVARVSVNENFQLLVGEFTKLWQFLILPGGWRIVVPNEAIEISIKTAQK